MANLVDTRVKHSTGQMDMVGFDTDEGAVDLTRYDDGAVSLEIGFEEASPADVDAILDDMADDDRFPDAALELARSIVDDARDGKTVEEVDAGSETDDVAPEHSEGEVVHVTDDGTEVRVGDRINHPGGWSYKITGKRSDSTLSMISPSDDYAVTVSTVEKDIREQGFEKRVGE